MQCNRNLTKRTQTDGKSQKVGNFIFQNRIHSWLAINLCRLALGGQTEENMRRLVYEFELSTKVIAIGGQTKHKLNAIRKLALNCVDLRVRLARTKIRTFGRATSYGWDGPSKQSLSVLMLWAPVLIFTSGSSALLGPYLPYTSEFMPIVLRENGQNTNILEVRHFVWCKNGRRRLLGAQLILRELLLFVQLKVGCEP